MNETVLVMSVDGTHCRIQEPRNDPSKSWYSHKLNKPALAYELGVDLVQSKLVWINGPFRAGNTDLNIFRREDGLKSRIPAGMMLIGDKGYDGERQVVSTPNDLDSTEIKRFKTRARARHETINGRIKEFGILKECFRHPVAKHGIAFEAVCVIVQYSLENGRPMFDI